MNAVLTFSSDRRGLAIMAEAVTCIGKQRIDPPPTDRRVQAFHAITRCKVGLHRFGFSPQAAKHLRRLIGSAARPRR